MRELLEGIELDGVPLFPPYYDDDMADRLSHRQTTALLAAFAFMVVTMQFVGEPINCWTPAHFKKPQEAYADSHCWSRGTYHLPYDSDIPPDVTYDAELQQQQQQQQQHRPRLSYYQYVPLILLGQALCFYLPYFAWTRLSGRSGLDVQSLLNAARSADAANDMADVQSRTLRDMTRQLDRYLSSRACLAMPNNYRLASSSTRFAFYTALCKHRHGNYLIRCYILIKLLYVVNVVAQLFLLDAFLGTPFHVYGVEVLRGVLIRGKDWVADTTVRFPRITMCDLKVYRLGAVHRYTVQCVLSINLFNQKIFLFVWFWLVLVGIVAFCSLVMWTARFSYAPGRRHYVKTHLNYVEPVVTETDKRWRKKNALHFVHRYLDQDGVFILRLVAHNTSTITVTELVGSLWKNYKNKLQLMEKDSDVEDNLL